MEPSATYPNDQRVGVGRFGRIVFWGPYVVSHVTDLIQELAIQFPETEFVYCADHGLLNERKELGLFEISSDLYLIKVDPEDDEIENLVNNDVDSTLHVFVGIRWVKCIVKALNIIKIHPSVKFGIMTEPRVREGFKGKIRIIHSLLTEGWIRTRVSFVLAIGSHGVKWFKAAGYISHKLYPFAYFIAPPHFKPIEYESDNKLVNKIRLGYVGRLVNDKGIYDILKAVSKISEIPVKLFVVGDGVERKKLLFGCESLGIDYEYLGVIPIATIPMVMSNIDILLLASTTTNDGWGVVVSEALMMGTPVVLTKPVGASILLINSIFGRVVNKKCPDSIKNAVLDIVQNNQFDLAVRKERSDHATAMLSSKFGVKYFDSVLSYVFHGGEAVIPWPAKL